MSNSDRKVELLKQYATELRDLTDEMDQLFGVEVTMVFLSAFVDSRQIYLEYEEKFFEKNTLEDGLSNWYGVISEHRNKPNPHKGEENGTI